MKILFPLILVLFSTNYAHAAGDNHIGLFVGATSLKSSTDFTLGLDYERKTSLLGGSIGYGILLDNNFASKNIFIVGIPIFWHPYEGFKFLLAPGYEFKEGGTVLDSQSGTRVQKKAVQKYLTRVGVGYDFHVGSYPVGPLVSVDFIDGGDTGVVYGVAGSLGF